MSVGKRPSVGIVSDHDGLVRVRPSHVRIVLAELAVLTLGLSIPSEPFEAAVIHGSQIVKVKAVEVRGLEKRWLGVESSSRAEQDML